MANRKTRGPDERRAASSIRPALPPRLALAADVEQSEQVASAERHEAEGKGGRDHDYGRAGQVRDHAGDGVLHVLDGRVGDYVLPEDTWVVMAGNRSEDRCFGDRLSPAMVNRVVVIRLKPDLNDWVDWAFDSGIDTRIIAYVRFNPDSLLSFDPTKWDGEGNFSSPRAWEAMHRIMHAASFKKVGRDLRRVLTVGTLGSAVGNEFSGFLDVYEDLPSIESVLLDPDTAPIPTEASAKIAAAAMVANHADKKTLGALMRYVSRFEKMFEVCVCSV